MSVRLGGKQVGYGSPAPLNPTRRHEPPKYGDAQDALRRSKGRCLDLNLQLVEFATSRGRRYLPVAAHWAKVGQNGYTHVWEDKKLRTLTRNERRMTLQLWVDRHGGTVRALNALRKRGRKGGPITNYPMTWAQLVPYAAKVGAVMTPELKHPRFSYHYVAAHMDSVCKANDYPLWPMTLLWMSNARGKCNAFRARGLHFAIIFGNRKHLAYGRNPLTSWRADRRPTRIWGPPAARSWLV